MNKDNSSGCSDSEIEDLVSHSLSEAYSQCSKKRNDDDGDTESEIHDRFKQKDLLGTDIDKQSSEMLFTIDRSCKDNAINSQDTNQQPNKFATRKKCIRLDCGIDTDDLYINVNPERQVNKKIKHMQQLRITSATSDVMDKCVMKSNFEKLHEIPPYQESLNQLKKKRRMERDKTKGDNWYNLPAIEMTDERKNDLKILQMRKAVNPNRFYKANDITALPKYCQFGKIIETAADFYGSRIPRKQRKQTMADELLSDANFTSSNKRKYTEILEAKRSGTGPYQARREREKKKDRKRRLRKAAKVF